MLNPYRDAHDPEARSYRIQNPIIGSDASAFRRSREVHRDGEARGRHPWPPNPDRAARRERLHPRQRRRIRPRPARRPALRRDAHVRDGPICEHGERELHHLHDRQTLADPVRGEEREGARARSWNDEIVQRSCCEPEDRSPVLQSTSGATQCLGQPGSIASSKRHLRFYAYGGHRRTPGRAKPAPFWVTPLRVIETSPLLRGEVTPRLLH